LYFLLLLLCCCYYVGNQSCVKYPFNLLRNLLFILKFHLLLSEEFFCFFFVFFFFIKHSHNIQSIKISLYKFNFIINTPEAFYFSLCLIFFFFLIVPYPVNFYIRPFRNNKYNYEIFFLCFSALPEINPIYDIRICNCVHILFYYTFSFIVHPNSLQCCIFVLYLPVHILVFLWMRGGSYFTTYKI